MTQKQTTLDVTAARAITTDVAAGGTTGPPT